MPLRVVTPPSALPVSVAEAKQFARIDHTADDDLVETLIEMARDHIEQVTNRTLKPTSYELNLRDWPKDGVIRLPRAPVFGEMTLQYRSAADGGELFTLTEGTDYYVDDAAAPVTIEPAKAWPRVADGPDGVIVGFTAGYPDINSPAESTVPARARVAVKSLVAHFYENREPATFGQLFKVPRHVETLLNGLRIWRVS